MLNRDTGTTVISQTVDEIINYVLSGEISSDSKFRTIVALLEVVLFMSNVALTRFVCLVVFLFAVNA